MRKQILIVFISSRLDYSKGKNHSCDILFFTIFFDEKTFAKINDTLALTTLRRNKREKSGGSKRIIKL